MPTIIPAILTKNINDYKNKLSQLKGLVSLVQIDIMDNKFVPNISVKVSDIADIKTDINLEAHLMIEQPEKIFKHCEQAGFRRVIFHLEGTNNPDAVLDEMKKFNFERGIAINPETSIEKILPFLDKIDIILFLTVNPGFYGSPFIPAVIDKIKELKKIKGELKIEVDGGINLKNIKSVADAGVNYIVVGSAIFKDGDIEENLKHLKNEINNN